MNIADAIAVVAVTAIAVVVAVVAVTADVTAVVHSLLLLRPVWITFLCYNFSVVAVFAVIYSKTMANGQLSLLKSYRNCPYC